jgi:hypothetical protein
MDIKILINIIDKSKLLKKYKDFKKYIEFEDNKNFVYINDPRESYNKKDVYINNDDVTIYQSFDNKWFLKRENCLKYENDHKNYPSLCKIFKEYNIISAICKIDWRNFIVMECNNIFKEKIDIYITGYHLILTNQPDKFNPCITIETIEIKFYEYYYEK